MFRFPAGPQDARCLSVWAAELTMLLEGVELSSVRRTIYTTQGFLAIDNNVSERALQRVAIGRKNWLFAGHDQAAASHARLWSLIASAERHSLDRGARRRSISTACSDCWS